jgi:hypothetical protein
LSVGASVTHASAGSALTLDFSRSAQRSLTLRPAYSPRRQATCFLEGFEGFVTSTAAPIAIGWSDLCRVGIAPTGELHLFTTHRHPCSTGQFPGRRSQAISRCPRVCSHDARVTNPGQALGVFALCSPVSVSFCDAGPCASAFPSSTCSTKICLLQSTIRPLAQITPQRRCGKDRFR